MLLQILEIEVSRANASHGVATLPIAKADYSFIGRLIDKYYLSLDNLLILISFQSTLLNGFGLEKAVYLQPVHESIKPAITRSVGISKAETVATVLVEVKLDRYARFVPGINYTKLTAEKKIIGSDNIKHGRSVLRHLHRAHSAIDWADESQFHGL